MERRRTLALVSVALALTLARTLRAPDAYAMGYWLDTYSHGLIKRGLVGTLVSPLFAWKAPDEGVFILQTLSLLLMVALAVAVIASVRPLVNTEAPAPTRWALLVSVFAVVTSPWVVFAGHANGFLDRWLELLTLGALALQRTRARYLVPALAVVGVAIHEMFLLYGLPVLVLATVLETAPLGVRKVGRALAVLCLPAILAYGLLNWSTSTLSPTDIDAMRDAMRATGVLSTRSADYAVSYLSHDLAANAAMQEVSVWERLTRVDLASLAGPPTALFLVWCGIGLWRGPRWRLLLLPAVFTPLVLHAVAWDTSRFTILVVFQAFVAWLAVLRVAPLTLSRRSAGLLVAAGLAVVASNLVQRAPLTDGEIDGEGTLSIRTGPALRTFDRCSPVFQNADFELGSTQGWKAEGDAFKGAVRQIVSVRGVRTPPGALGRWWLGTYGLTFVDGKRTGDARTGTLRSPSFHIRGDTMITLVGGGRNARDLRVSLLVEGVEVAWATGQNDDTLRPAAWDVSAWEGQSASIEIVDNATSRWGHIDVDGFWWFRPYP